MQYNPFLLVVMCDFNEKWRSWCANDQSSFKDNKIEHKASQLGLSQFINETKHNLDTISSCTDLFSLHFSTQLVIELGVHSSSKMS